MTITLTSVTKRALIRNEDTRSDFPSPDIRYPLFYILGINISTPTAFKVLDNFFKTDNDLFFVSNKSLKGTKNRKLGFPPKT